MDALGQSSSSYFNLQALGAAILIFFNHCCIHLVVCAQ